MAEKSISLWLAQFSLYGENINSLCMEEKPSISMYLPKLHTSLQTWIPVIQ